MLNSGFASSLLQYGGGGGWHFQLFRAGIGFFLSILINRVEGTCGEKINLANIVVAQCKGRAGGTVGGTLGNRWNTGGLCVPSTARSVALCHPVSISRQDRLHFHKNHCDPSAQQLWNPCDRTHIRWDQ